MKKDFLTVFILCLFFTVAYGEVPVVDITDEVSDVATEQPYVSTQDEVNGQQTDAATPIEEDNAGTVVARQTETAHDTESRPSDKGDPQRVAQLERQVAYLRQLNLPAKFMALQQTIQDLRGLVEVQAHRIAALEAHQPPPHNIKPIAKTKKASTISPFSRIIPWGRSTTPPAAKPKVEVLSSAPKVAPIPQSETTLSVKEELKTYVSAFNLIKKKQYSDAIAGLQTYLKEYPHGQYAASAHYWLGELWIISGHNDQAQDEFRLVIDQYPHSDKRAEALFKLGGIAYDASQGEEAQQLWNTLIKDYPESSAARIAHNRLEQLKG